MGKFFEPCSGSNVSKSIASFKLRKEALGRQSKSGIASRQFSSQYKGVVPQHNGKWGAQIYVSHQRLWLGTFNNELEAALAYDRACLKFRSAERRQNLLNGKQCQIENNFQELYSKKQVVQMIKDHSYTQKFNYFISIRSGVPADAGESRENINYVRNHGQYMVNPEHLFDKEVTPSDVGKLNRLVIPKQHAERNFPPESQINDRDETLVFLDENNKEWEFRYSFWKSSRSYVLTRGWKRFVKEKQLQAGNIVSFQRCRATGKLYISIPHHPNYLRPSAEGIGSQPMGRGRNVVYSSPFTTEASLVVNEHDRPLHFHNKSLVLQNHGTILPVPMGYYSEWIHGGTQVGDESIVEGRISNIDIRKETMEQSLFPSHETQDGIGGRDDATVACQSRSRSYQTPHAPTNETISTNSIRLFGVEIGSVVQKQ